MFTDDATKGLRDKHLMQVELRKWSGLELNKSSLILSSQSFIIKMMISICRKCYILGMINAYIRDCKGKLIRYVSDYIKMDAHVSLYVLGSVLQMLSEAAEDEFLKDNKHFLTNSFNLILNSKLRYV